mmetsp:Transcript_33103/g.40634  ORF Transcript_33103/g.40634 Transcript_33103/m.40634 type:complete len:81 (-) Transcript_33103:48-290(-)
MGIGRDSKHKRSHTGARREKYRKKGELELARSGAFTKIGEERVSVVRCMGGNINTAPCGSLKGTFRWVRKFVRGRVAFWM